MPEFDCFPYQPYSIQNELMNSLYDFLNRNEIQKVGIFQSPTGTGKSLSLLSSVLTWWKDYYEKETVNEQEQNSRLPDWVKAFQMKQKREREREPLKTFKKRRKQKKKGEEGTDETDLIDYQSEVSSTDDEEDNDDDDIDDNDDKRIKIFYCSRTHSQLHQCVEELQKLKMKKKMNAIVLGSRKNYCINKKVNNGKKSVMEINDECRNLKEGKGCEFYKHKEISKVKTEKEIVDIEDLLSKGEKEGICPYYCSRTLAKKRELIFMPYNFLLQEEMRESMEIELHNSIVILDEAHNLLESINQMNTIALNKSMMEQVRSSLEEYVVKYNDRLGSTSKNYLKQLTFILKAMDNFQKKQNEPISVFSINDYLHHLAIDHFNIFKLLHFIKESQLAKKLLGFIKKRNKENLVDDIQFSPVYPLTAFLSKLMNPDKTGKIFLYHQQDDHEVKYLNFNPADSFEFVISKARSVILAGGTMSPLDDFIDQLFPSFRNQCHLFECGHIISSKNLLSMVISQGPTKGILKFTYETRNDTSLLHSYGISLLNYSQIIPDGMVLFFPSYQSLSTTLDYWESSGIKAKIEKKKKFFLENQSCDSQKLFHDYKRWISLCGEQFVTHSTGAILCCVVNGKLSEGINFSDKLARAVLVVGLPFPNWNSIEIKEKLKYLDPSPIRTAIHTNYYENTCMRAVNQSIGRTIRHAKDYAAILLLDCRYSRLLPKIPKWIHESTTVVNDFGSSVQRLRQFFKENQQ